MAQAVPFIMLAVTVAGTAYSIKTQADAAKEAERLANRNAAAASAEAEEAARRAEKDAQRIESLSRAKAAASGIGGESTDLYLKEMQITHQEQIEWIKKAGASQSDIYKHGGQLAKQQGYAGAWGAAASGGSQIAGQYYSGKAAGAFNW